MPFGAQDSGPFYHGTKADLSYHAAEIEDARAEAIAALDEPWRRPPGLTPASSG